MVYMRFHGGCVIFFKEIILSGAQRIEGYAYENIISPLGKILKQGDKINYVDANRKESQFVLEMDDTIDELMKSSVCAGHSSLSSLNMEHIHERE